MNSRETALRKANEFNGRHEHKLKAAIKKNKVALKPYGKYNGNTDSLVYTGRTRKEQTKEYSVEGKAGPVGKSIRRKMRKLITRLDKFIR